MMQVIEANPTPNFQGRAYIHDIVDLNLAGSTRSVTQAIVTASGNDIVVHSGSQATKSRGFAPNNVNTVRPFHGARIQN